MQSPTRAPLRTVAEWDLRAWTALLVCALLVYMPTAAYAAKDQPPERPLPPEVFKPLDEALQKSYLELFDEASKLEFTPQQIEKMRQYLKDSRSYCRRLWAGKIDQWEKELRAAQAELRSRTRTLKEAQRKQYHCKIQNLRLQIHNGRMLRQQAIPTAYENRLAKLDLIEKWPAEEKQIRAEIASGAYTQRKYGDVLDIGFRDVGRGQEQDVKVGRDAIREMKLAGLMPPEVKNEVVRRYVTDLARKIARNSDLRVPVQVTVLNSKEINAFALPGGFLFVQRGLLEAVEDESQLAGVIAHETAHAAARHGHRLMKRATISSIIYQAAQVAALIFTGGAASIGLYYALQYGFYGLGMILSLDLLGVSRDLELEADQLGVQYAWKAGYDPTGFIRFFDKMATQEGYVRGLSWFRTHPPFYQRMVHAKREIMFLPEKKGLIRNTDAFDRMKKALKEVTAKAEEEEQDRPSLLAPETGCPKPQMPEMKPGKRRVETVCNIPID